ncbi:NAD(P)H-hydrate dehydratase [Maricaulis sp.]|uniref:NAD(P)H-hydrate dehydratase n=1 Tax=Maricaulis sp. TaxID=1486257 RepID=UPI0025C0068E|nr:NAD(P)H-hydrate dehydratase [Maricaulis sp.]
MNGKLLDHEAVLLRIEAMMQKAILSTADIALCDRYAIEHGVAGTGLMENAGRAVAKAICQRWAPRPTLILCGPGNNGGDGYVVARYLRDQGWPVTLASLVEPKALKDDALWAYQQWSGDTRLASRARTEDQALIVDAMFGAGLTRPLDGPAADLVRASNTADAIRVAIDLPSGLSGDMSALEGPVFHADLSVTFHRCKPAHFLQPGADLCGEVVLADIGIPNGWQAEITPVAYWNVSETWRQRLPCSGADTHKHQRGRLAVFSGPAGSTGAARLAAMAGLRTGAGLVTVVSPKNAMAENAEHLTAIMLREAEVQAGDDLSALRATSAVMGPAYGTGLTTRDQVLAALGGDTKMVLDADALSSFEGHKDALFAALRAEDVLTPHFGEFRRLFPGIALGPENKIEIVREAAEKAGCVVLLKGADTVIAAPGQTPVVNTHASPVLATAGSGDVLAGLIAGLIAQGVDSFTAACAGAWIHGDAGWRFGQGLVAEDLPGSVAETLRRLEASARRAEVYERLANRV